LTSAQVGVASVIGRALAVPGADGRDGQSWRSGRRHRTAGCCNNGDGSLCRRAASRVRQALESRPADVALRARASGLVQDDAAKSVLAAGLSQRAGILTLSLDATLVHRAIVVGGTGAI
jgi:hypothetical protein